MRQKMTETVERVQTVEECRHHWAIAGAEGPTSRGVCKRCGAEKEFPNTLPDAAPIKRSSRVLGLPEMPDVEIDEEMSS